MSLSGSRCLLLCAFCSIAFNTADFFLFEKFGLSSKTTKPAPTQQASTVVMYNQSYVRLSPPEDENCLRPLEVPGKFENCTSSPGISPDKGLLCKCVHCERDLRLKCHAGKWYPQFPNTCDWVTNDSRPPHGCVESCNSTTLPRHVTCEKTRTGYLEEGRFCDCLLGTNSSRAELKCTLDGWTLKKNCSDPSTTTGNDSIIQKDSGSSTTQGKTNSLAQSGLLVFTILCILAAILLGGFVLVRRLNLLSRAPFCRLKRGQAGGDATYNVLSFRSDSSSQGGVNLMPLGGTTCFTLQGPPTLGGTLGNHQGMTEVEEHVYETIDGDDGIYSEPEYDVTYSEPVICDVTGPEAAAVNTVRNSLQVDNAMYGKTEEHKV